MKIAHLCLSNGYIDHYNYQENELVRQHVATGHDVLVLASTVTISKAGQPAFVAPSEYLGEDGAWVRRIPYRRLLPQPVMRKLGMFPRVYQELALFRPDTILFHGASAWELRTVARYVRDHPGTLFYVDCHADYNNGARGWLSRELLHRRYHGPNLRSALPWIDKILCISTESMTFVRELYRVPQCRTEFFPLGGHPLTDGEYTTRRVSARAQFGIAPDQIALVASGKQKRRKKLIESLTAFAEQPNPKLRLYIAGVLDPEIEEHARKLISADPRVTFLGWLSYEPLTDLLCAADIYLQPGSQSVTMQHSLCCRCAVILDNVPAHQVYKCENGWFLDEKLSLDTALSEIDTADIATMQSNSATLAREILDYATLAERILS